MLPSVKHLNIIEAYHSHDKGPFTDYIKLLPIDLFDRTLILDCIFIRPKPSYHTQGQ